MRGTWWLCALIPLAACEPASPDQPVVAQYISLASEALDAQLVAITARAAGPNDSTVRDYARCGIARQALLRGEFFARPVRLSVSQDEAGIWTADGVYTLSPELPPGVDVVDAEVTVLACEAQGIPTL